MPANVEIKARAPEPGRLQAAVESLDALRGPAEELDQEDIYFAVPDGRLKLRRMGDGTGELIRYQRSDCCGPKVSHYTIVPTGDPAALRAILESCLRVEGVVRKRRRVYHVGQTRIHLDRVEGLGRFVELEVVLRPDQTSDEGAELARRLMTTIGIAGRDLIVGSYLDLLQATP